MEVATDEARARRTRELEVEDRAQENDKEAARRGDTDFTKVYSKGWRRLQVLMREKPMAARVYAFLAEHIEPSCGAVVASQELMARELGVSEITIRRHTKDLEEMGALVRIRVGTGVYAYALDPTEIWKSWADKKDQAAFTARTMAKKSDRANGDVKRRLQVMMRERS